jgi:hypothetical protein
MHYRRFIIRFGFIMLTGLSVTAAPGPESGNTRRACSCADGRQFSVGSSLFGKNSARVVVKGFVADPAQTVSVGQLPACNDLTVVGQVVRLKTASDRPFFQRESIKRGTIRNICQTKIQFVEPKKSYDFFADDGSAVTLSDVDAGQTPSSDEEVSSSKEKQTGESGPDLTGKDLIQLIPREQAIDDPGASAFDADDLKEGAYFIVRRQLKALPALDESAAEVTQNGSANASREQVTVWAGTLGRIEKRAGFRSEPLWMVEILPHSAPLSFSRSLGLIVQTIHRNHPFAKKFVLPASDIVEINHFFDQYRLEWTRFGMASEDVQARESLGTTVLPDLYDPPEFTLEQNLKNAQKTRAFEAVQAAALRLVFVPKVPTGLSGGQMLVLDEGASPESARGAVPHLFRRQCFLGASKSTALSSMLPVSDVDIRVFQPSHSAQVPDDYYAIDLRLQLRSDTRDSGFPVVCRFPLTTISVDLLNKAERILSSQFEIRKRETR